MNLANEKPWVRVARKLISTEGVVYLALLTVVVVVIGGAIFAEVEEQKLSLWDGIWWAVQTITTVGYGDVIPTSSVGRIVAICLMFIGIGFVILLTAAATERIIRPDVAEAEEEIEEELEREIMVPERQIFTRLDEISQRLERLERRL